MMGFLCASMNANNDKEKKKMKNQTLKHNETIIDFFLFIHDNSPLLMKKQ